MKQSNRQVRAKKKAKQNRVMRNPLGSAQGDVLPLLKKALRKRLTNAT